LNQVLFCSFYPSFGADLLIAFIGAILGVGGAYGIYIYSIRQYRRDRLKYVVSLIENVIRSAREQADFCNKHKDIILENPFANHELKLLADRDTKRLADKLDQEGVFHAYLWKYKRTEQTYKDFKNLYGVIDFLDYLVDDLMTVNVKMMNNTWERKKQYQFNFTRAKEMMQSLYLDETIKKEQSELQQLIREQLELFAAFQGENLKPSFELVVEPIRNFIFEKGKKQDKVTEILFRLDELDSQYSGITYSAEHNAKDYEYYAKHLQEKAGELENMSAQLRRDYSNLK
jgi:hypothetical protein